MSKGTEDTMTDITDTTALHPSTTRRSGGRRRAALAGGAVAVAAVVGVGVGYGGLAGAQDADPGVGPGPGDGTHCEDHDHAGGRRFGGAGHEAVLELLDMTADELRAAHRDGQSLADIAAAKGVATEDVVDAMLAGVEERITARVNGEPPERGEGRGPGTGPGTGRGERWGS